MLTLLPHLVSVGCEDVMNKVFGISRLTNLVKSVSMEKDPVTDRVPVEQ